VIGTGYLVSTFLYSKRLFFKDIAAVKQNYVDLLKKHYHFSNWLLGTSILQWFSGNFFLIVAASTLGTTAVGAVRMVKIGLKIGAIVLLILSTMTIAAPHLIHWIYGASFVSYSYVVWGYCLLYIFVFIGYPVRYFFRTIRFTKPIFVAYCFSTLFSLVIAFPVVNTWGITGLLIGLIVSQIVTLAVYAYFLWGKLTTSRKEIRPLGT